MNNPTCSHCLYYSPILGGNGVCVRFPRSEGVGKNYWCGEFKCKECLCSLLEACDCPTCGSPTCSEEKK